MSDSPWVTTDNSVWTKLSAIDCSAHIEKKGQFSYLAWTWAWAMVKEQYPLASYELLPDTVYPDGTMEVRVKVGIGSKGWDRDGVFSGDYVSNTMWLPVLDFKNKAISKPNAFDINSARMRCLVKCLAMFGLGHYIYAGESAPQEVAEDISAEVFALNESKTLDELQAVFKRSWGLYPRSREELTKIKDTKKKELTDD